MSAIKDVQHSLNVIRRLSTDENAAVQTQILELMLQASISQLKSIGLEPKATNSTPAPTKPVPLPIPKPPRASVSSADTTAPATQLDLRSIKPQAPIS